jgi:CRP/FNR family transcriptional regulator
MPCTNCECPFHELQAEIGRFSATELGCMVADAAKQVTFRAGEVLFAQGQSSSSLYSLTSGLVKITSHSPDGREQIVGFSNPGKLLVGLQSINDECYEYSAVAATDVSACKIMHRALLTAVKDRVDVAMRLISAVNAQLAHSRSLMRVMGHKCAAAKIASFILLVAPEAINGNDRFTLPISRMDMAGLLGLSEETVCRQMAEMKRKGVIYAPRGKMQVKNWHQLRVVAGGADDTGQLSGKTTPA